MDLTFKNENNLLEVHGLSINAAHAYREFLLFTGRLEGTNPPRTDPEQFLASSVLHTAQQAYASVANVTLVGGGGKGYAAHLSFDLLFGLGRDATFTLQPIPGRVLVHVSANVQEWRRSGVNAWPAHSAYVGLGAILCGGWRAANSGDLRQGAIQITDICPPVAGTRVAAPTYLDSAGLAYRQGLNRDVWLIGTNVDRLIVSATHNSSVANVVNPTSYSFLRIGVSLYMVDSQYQVNSFEFGVTQPTASDYGNYVNAFRTTRGPYTMTELSALRTWLESVVPTV